MSLSKVIRPEIFGPGYWAVIHTDAKRAKTLAQKLAFIAGMRPRLESLLCRMCRDHSLEYLDKHPIINWIDVEDGMFLWTYYFHNDVNLRLGKREFPLSEVDELWSGIFDCEDCSVPDVPETMPKVKITPYRPS